MPRRLCVACRSAGPILQLCRTCAYMCSLLWCASSHPGSPCAIEQSSALVHAPGVACLRALLDLLRCERAVREDAAANASNMDSVRCVTVQCTCLWLLRDAGRVPMESACAPLAKTGLASTSSPRCDAQNATRAAKRCPSPQSNPPVRRVHRHVHGAGRHQSVASIYCATVSVVASGAIAKQAELGSIRLRVSTRWPLDSRHGASSTEVDAVCDSWCDVVAERVRARPKRRAAPCDFVEARPRQSAP